MGPVRRATFDVSSRRLGGRGRTAFQQSAAAAISVAPPQVGPVERVGLWIGLPIGPVVRCGLRMAFAWNAACPPGVAVIERSKPASSNVLRVCLDRVFHGQSLAGTQIQLSEIELAAAGFREALHSERGVDALRGCL